MNIIGIALGLSLGALAGGWLGSTRSCESGACPLTSTPFRGALWGGLIGALLAFSLSANSPSPAAETGAAKGVVKELGSLADFNKEVATNAGPVAIKFYATWCPPCKEYAPIFDKVAEELAGQAGFYISDVDKAGDLAKKFAVESIPTTIFLVNGKEKSRKVGVVAAEDLKEILKALK